MKTVDIIYHDAGGAHRSTTNALHQELQKRGDVNPRRINLYETGILKAMDFSFAQGINIYNFMLKMGLTFIDPLYLFLCKLNISYNYSAGVRFMESYWREHQPDVVVSTIPFLNRMLYESLQRAKPGTPFFTLLVDFADCSPFYDYWIEPQKQFSNLFVFCPTQRAVEQAQSRGYPKESILRISGAVINSRFHKPITADRRIERQRLGLNPDLPTGLVMFGGYGSMQMLEIAKRLERSFLNLQLIFICGRNEKVARMLRRIPSTKPRFIETFTNEIPYYMYLSDFFIGKTGCASTTEALAMNLPIITECNFSTLVQEQYNAEWLVENEAGIVLRNFRDVDKAVAKLIEPKNFAYYRKAATSINNKAVFEVTEILDNILELTTCGSPK